MTTCIETLDSALAHAKRGWPVLVLHGIREGKCTCTAGEACEDAGKHPRIMDWTNAASTDPAVIRGWFERWPDSNLGILTGRRSGLVVLDVDPRNGGDESLRVLEATHGLLPDTVESETGGGGRHVLFEHPGGVLPKRTGLLPGLDVCSDGAQIVAPPSLHVSGRRYAWELRHHPDDVALAKLPAWLLEQIRGAENRTGPSAPGDPIPKSRRNQTLASLAGSMRRRGMSQEAIEAALQQENAQRCKPPLDPNEVSRIAKSVASYEPVAAAVHVDLPEVLVPGGHTDESAKYFEIGADRFVAPLIEAIPRGEIYRRASLVGTLEGEPGNLRFKEATEARLRLIVDQHVRLVKWVKPKAANRVKVFDPCRNDYARLLREAASTSERVRDLRELTSHPVFVGPSVDLVVPGWNEDARAYYDQPDELKHVTAITDLDRIHEILDDLVMDFPFKDVASRENFHGLLLTPLLRPAMPEANTPLHVVTSSLERTGKGKLASDTFGGVVLGRSAPLMPWTGSEEERDKRIIGMLTRGDTILVIDNLDANETLDSAVLSALLTSRTYRGRILGGNRIVDLPNTLTIVATGNNVRCSSEITKRAVPIILQPATDHPEARADFQHPDLTAHVQAVRKATLGALLGMVENWKRHGRPLHERAMGGFETWSKTVGGVLYINGFGDWMANWNDWLRRADPDGEDLRAFVEAWANRWATEWRSPKELLQIVEELGVFSWIQKARNEQGKLVSFAKTVLRRHENRPVGAWLIRSTGSGSMSRYYLEVNQ